MADKNKLLYEEIIKEEFFTNLDEQITNSRGQIIHLFDHDLTGVVHAVSHELKLAADTEFFDTEDLTGGEDYTPCFVDGELKFEYEL